MSQPLVRDIIPPTAHQANNQAARIVSFSQQQPVSRKVFAGKQSRARVFIQRFYYVALFMMLIGSLILFASYSTHYGLRIWEIYNRVYLLTLLAYTWFTLILLFIGEVRTRKYQRYSGERISVVLPCYNEKPALLKRSIKSVLAARGNKEIVIVDDGSTNNIKPLLKEFAQQNANIRVHSFTKNKGKRHALHYAIKHLIGDSKFIVTIDSDTVLDKDALVRVVEPLNDAGIGAATGDVQLLNEKQNWLTRMVGSYYWIGLNIYKKAQSSLGIVVCCSGCLSAYKRQLADEIIDNFLYQEFFGERCTHSEDRHLTNLVLERGYQVVYVPEAISFTETPATIKGFLKQQQRWKRGYIRESLYTLSYAWRTKPVLFFQILLWDLTVPFFSFGLMLALVMTVFTNPTFFLFTMLPAWVAFMFVRYLPLLLHARDKLVGLFIYMFFYDVFLYWQSVYALFTVKNKSWITR